MKSISKHISAAGTLLLLLFFLANSGFTVAFVHCTMCDDSAMATGCCEDMAHATRLPMEADTQQSTDATLATSSLQCMVVTLVGGLPSGPTILDKESVARSNTRFDLMPASAPEPADVRIAFERPILHSSLPPNTSLISVEKYVLNAALLI